MSLGEHLIYALLWLSFGVLHSLLADQRLKTALTGLVGGKYRLIYNLIATAHFVAIFLVGRWWLSSGAVAFSWSPLVHLVATGAQILGLGVIIVAFTHYDLGRFSGLKELRSRAADAKGGPDAETLHTEGLHRWVRHPLYLGVFLVIWARASDEFALATAIWASLYLVIGTMMEERRLLMIYGEDYAVYQSRVPMFLPWKLFTS